MAREFVPEYMQGDIFDRPERNARPNSWGSNGGLEEDGIRIGPHSNPSNLGNPSNDDGALNLPRESSHDSPSYPDETSLDPNKNDGNIFSKLFGNQNTAKQTNQDWQAAKKIYLKIKNFFNSNSI